MSRCRVSQPCRQRRHAVCFSPFSIFFFMLLRRRFRYFFEDAAPCRPLAEKATCFYSALPALAVKDMAPPLRWLMPARLRRFFAASFYFASAACCHEYHADASGAFIRPTLRYFARSRNERRGDDDARGARLPHACRERLRALSAATPCRARAP